MCPNAAVGGTGEGGNIRESIPDVSRFRTNGPEGESCVFDMLEVCGGRTGCVSGFVSSFWATFMYKTFSSELRIILYDFSKFKQYSEITINSKLNNKLLRVPCSAYTEVY